MSFPLPGASLEAGWAPCNDATFLQSPLSLTQAVLINKKPECCWARVIQGDSHHLGLQAELPQGWLSASQVPWQETFLLIRCQPSLVSYLLSKPVCPLSDLLLVHTALGVSHLPLPLLKGAGNSVLHHSDFPVAAESKEAGICVEGGHGIASTEQVFS